MQFLAGTEPLAAVGAVLREAGRALALVTPTFDPPGDLMRHLSEARSRGVRVTLFLRDEEEHSEALLEVCEGMGIAVRKVPGLRGALYASEKAVVLTSMCLDAGLDGWDVAIRIDRADDPVAFQDAVRLVPTLEAYVETERNRVEPLSKPLFAGRRRRERDVEAPATATARKQPPNAGKPWGPDADDELRLLWERDEGVDQIAAAMGRTKVAIAARLVRLGLAPDREAVRRKGATGQDP